MKALVVERNLPRFAAARVASVLGSGRGDRGELGGEGVPPVGHGRGHLVDQPDQLVATLVQLEPPLAETCTWTRSLEVL